MTAKNIAEIPLRFLKSVGPKKAASFSKVGINSVQDILFYFPTRYLDRSNILSIRQVYRYVAGGYEGEVTVIARVMGTDLLRFGKKQIFKVKFQDKTGFLDAVWFQGIKYFKNKFKEGDFYAISAKPSFSRYGHLQMVHPDFDYLSSEESEKFNTGKIIPFYRLPKELKTGKIGDLSLRRIIHNAVEEYVEQVPETLPQSIISQNQLCSISYAIRNLHFPDDFSSLNKAKYRFKMEEILYIELIVALRKFNIKKTFVGYSFRAQSRLVHNFLDTLPFQLTEAQLRVLSELRRDLENEEPMNRLIQGDVGSGKTIVSLISMLIVLDNKFQTALMAPTEILADQHFKTINKMVEPLGLPVCKLLGGQKKSEREENLSIIQNNERCIIVGTHALIEDNVNFKKLGLIVIDEQHRFGVVQRSRLIEKGYSPDVLVMTATPIPRTLSMTVYGDLDISTIDQMPKNRKAIKTFVRGENKLPAIYKFILDKVKERYQAFIVYPLVEESEKLDLKAAESYYNELKESYFKNVSVGLIHGKMNWREKEEVMLAFAEKKFDVLISTTVIEVGIDVPNANIMVINDAYRFGLSQLHQLRGRVGRGIEQAYCILVTKDEFYRKTTQFNFNFNYLSPAQIEKNKSNIRLSAMAEYTDGFKLSEIDMKLRGPGNIYGTRQSGFPEFKYIDITEDTDLIKTAKEQAFEIIKNDPKLQKDENQLLKKTLLEFYKENLKYSKIA